MGYAIVQAARRRTLQSADLHRQGVDLAHPANEGLLGIGMPTGKGFCYAGPTQKFVSRNPRAASILYGTPMGLANRQIGDGGHQMILPWGQVFYATELTMMAVVMPWTGMSTNQEKFVGLRGPSGMWMSLVRQPTTGYIGLHYLESGGRIVEGPALPLYKPAVVVATWKKTPAGDDVIRLYIDGIMVAEATNPFVVSSPSVNLVYRMMVCHANYWPCNRTYIRMGGAWIKAWHDAMVREVSKNPAALLRPVSSPVFYSLPSSVSLTAANAATATAASTAALEQQHQLAGGGASSATAAQGAAASQVHVLTGASAASATGLSTGEVSIQLSLVADSAASATQASTGAIGQTHALAAAGASSATAASTGETSQGETHVLSAANASSATAASTAALAQAHLVIAAAAASATAATTGLAGQTHVLAAANVLSLTYLSNPNMDPDGKVYGRRAMKQMGSWMNAS